MNVRIIIEFFPERRITKTRARDFFLRSTIQQLSSRRESDAARHARGEARDEKITRALVTGESSRKILQLIYVEIKLKNPE